MIGFNYRGLAIVAFCAGVGIAALIAGARLALPGERQAEPRWLRYLLATLAGLLGLAALGLALVLGTCAFGPWHI